MEDKGATRREEKAKGGKGVWPSLIGTPGYVVQCNQHGTVLTTTLIDDVNEACNAHWQATHQSPPDPEAGQPGGVAPDCQIIIYNVNLATPADYIAPAPARESHRSERE